MVVGTVGYLSPEQISGLPAEARSDLFSLGAVLYEMLSGRRAFTGGSKIETLSAILRDDPLPISDADHPIPAALEAATRRCLEKDPSNRFDSARDLSFALKSVAENPAARPAGAPAVQSRTASSRAPVVAVVLAVAVLSSRCSASSGHGERRGASSPSPCCRSRTSGRTNPPRT